ncbi:MAG: hypothetical protein KDE47_08525, partial [Caldilineaceae bacterium]|nr:hypothetical protein [Caldilineaceae bacterium]
MLHQIVHRSLVRFKLLAGTAVLALETSTSRRWGIYVKPDKSVVVQYSDNGTTFSEAALLAANAFKHDTWYVLMVGTDNGTDLVRLWERDKAPESGSIVPYQSDKVSSSL